MEPKTNSESLGRSEAKYNNKDRVVATVRDFVMSIYDDDYKYFKGHVRDGNFVFPESAFLVLVWETLAMYENVINYKDLSVVFENVQFHGEAIITPELLVRLQIMILKGNNKFEITYENSMVVSGFVSILNANDKVNHNLQQKEESSDKVFLGSKDIYTIMRLRGYGYMDEFQSIHSSKSSRNKANIKWNDNWITYLDSLLQFNAFSKKGNGLSVPSHIKELRIDVQKHKNANVMIVDNVTCINADIYDLNGHTRSGGVEIDGLVFKDKPIVEQKPGILQAQAFVPHFLTGVLPIKTALQVNFQIVTENVNEKCINVVNLISLNASEVSKTITEVVTEISSHEFNINTINDNNNNIDELVINSDVVIIDNLLADKQKMNQIYTIIPQNTFILVLEQDTTKIHPQDKLFSFITTMMVHKQILLLLRKVDMTSNENVTYMPIVYDQKFLWVPRLQTELQRSRKIVLVSERQHYCGLLGLVNKLKQVHGNKIGLVVVDDFHAPSFNPEKDIFKEQLEKKLTFNVLKKGHWGGYYYMASKPAKQLENLYLTCTTPGDLDTLSWIEKPSLPETNNLVQVCYAGASMRDAKIAAGTSFQIAQAYGMDFSGINNRGENVMGIVSGGAIGSNVVVDPDLLWPVPEHWTLEDAATVPLAYTLAHYCLTIRYTLRRGLKVLINGGAGALCQAIISLCLSMNCDVYVTGCDVEQKKFLLVMFPDLQAENIGLGTDNVRTIQKIVDDVNNKDGNDIIRCQKRYDIVINCLSGSMRKAAMKYVGLYGTFFDICDIDVIKNDDFGMMYLNDAKTYEAVNLNTIFLPVYAKEKKLIQIKVAEGISKGIVRPLSRVVYTPDNVTGAFRYLYADKNRDTVLIRMKSLDSINEILNDTARMTYCFKGSYIVVGDETALSIELADRLVKGGARNLVIHMKPTSITGYCYTKFSSWNKLEVSLKISSENLQTENGCVNLFKEGSKLGPIRGIFIVHNFNSGESSGLEVVGAKFNNTVTVVANLDLISRNVCNELDHFVVLNYSSRGMSDEYVSSVTDKICRSRNETCLPALMFRAGQVKELDDSEMSNPRLQPQSLSAMFNALETSLKQKETNVITYSLKKNTASEFVQTISRIIGVKTILDLDECLSMKDLLLNEVSIEEINTAIKNAYRISYPTGKLRRMTIANLKHLEYDLSKTVSNKDSSLDAFFTYIDRDKCSAAEPIVTMTTSFSSVTEEVELDPKATYLMLVPGFEGHHQTFTTVSERLKVQAFTLQLVPNMPSDSIPQIAANIAKVTKKRLELKSKFYLLGYSFGVNVAFELARIFEKEGHVGVVYCLDSSPDALRAQLDAYIGDLTDSQLQNTIVEHMYKLMSGQHSAELKQELETKDNWNDKVEQCVNKLRGLVNYSHQYKRCLLNSAYRRIILAREYEPDFKLESELVLIKGVEQPYMGELAGDFNLSKYTKKPVRVFDIEYDHASAHQDCRVPNIVNRLLEPKLLEEFKNNNLCWTYLADPVKTW